MSAAAKLALSILWLAQATEVASREEIKKLEPRRREGREITGTSFAKQMIRKQLLVAHRGASGYAPEHTRAAYLLALRQGADLVEQDLQITRDGELICLHDPDLARTTNVEQLFPDRARMRDPAQTGNPKLGWYVVDFTLAEIKQLDAGSWFNNANPFAAKREYAGQKILTLQEAIETVGNRAGLYIETKHVPFYQAEGHDMVARLASVLKEAGLAGSPSSRERGSRASSPPTRKWPPPVIIQSFYKASLLYLQKRAPEHMRIQLLPMEDAGRQRDTSRITAELAAEVAAYAHGVGPAKEMIKGPAEVATLHSAGLQVHPYTFRGPTTAVQRQPLDAVQLDGVTLRQAIIADIRQFVGFGIDGGFTDYPELWREAVK